MSKSQTAVFRTPASSRRFLFALNFFKSPAMLGSLIPSSRFLVNDVLNQVDWDKARVIVEYGPGVGTITQEILKRMRPDAVLLALELNEEFVTFLREEIVDPRFHAVHASASDVRKVLARLGLPSADYIISGIPYSTMPHAVRREVMQESRQVLHPEGALLVYQFTNTVLPYLESSFGSVRQGFQFLNILPARIFYCTP
jgi:phospholipid N-methyltransferase